MPSYVPDGYTLTGYVSPPGQEDGQKLFEPLEFSYRVATRPEVLKHDFENSKLVRLTDESAYKKLEKAACKFVGDHLHSWDLKDGSGTAVELSEDAISRLQITLFNRIYLIIRNEAVSNKRPHSDAEPTTDADQLKN